jgi:hypothetical protein
MLEIEGRDGAEVVDLDGAFRGVDFQDFDVAVPLSLGQDERGLVCLGRLAGLGRHLRFEQGALDAAEGGNPLKEDFWWRGFVGFGIGRRRRRFEPKHVALDHALVGADRGITGSGIGGCA